MPEYCETVNEPSGSVQLNIVTVVDVRKALATGSLDGAIYMMDNSLARESQGTAQLQTLCKPGQVINWIIYPMDRERRPDGTWPPLAKINNIVFLANQDGKVCNVSRFKVCTNLKIYGMPDKMRSPLTPVYSYWAGIVENTLEPGIYRYRMVIQLEHEVTKEPIYLNTVETPSLKVVRSV